MARFGPIHLRTKPSNEEWLNVEEHLVFFSFLCKKREKREIFYIYLDLLTIAQIAQANPTIFYNQSFRGCFLYNHVFQPFAQYDKCFENFFVPKNMHVKNLEELKSKSNLLSGSSQTWPGFWNSCFISKFILNNFLFLYFYFIQTYIYMN